MAKEPDESNRPQPILIDSGTPALETEASENDATVRHDLPQPNASKPLAQAVERYESLKSTSDPGNFFAVFGLVIMAVSLFIGVSAAMDGLFNGGSGDGVELCFGGLFIGALLCVGGVAKSASHQGERKKALAEVKALAGFPEKKATPSYVIPGSSLCVLGILTIVLVEWAVGCFLLFGGLFTILFGALTVSASEKPEYVLAVAQEVLRRNE